MEKNEINSKATRQIIRQYGKVLNDLAALSSAFENLDSDIKTTCGKYIESCAENVLKNTDTDELKLYRLGIRTNLLIKNGYKNLYSVWKADKKKLTDINGIGSQTAWLLKSVANDIYRGAENAVRLRINTDDRKPEITRILRAVFTKRNTDGILQRASQLKTAYYDTISANLTAIDRNKSAVKWFFTSSADKDRARDAFAFFMTDETDEFTTEFSGILTEYGRITRASDDAVWNDYIGNSAEYYSEIEKLMPNLMASSYYGADISKEFRAEIEKTEPVFNGLKCTLRGYQKFGVQFILKQKNVLLGDEMGLGKTVEAIAVMTALKSAGDTHFLVVCPAAVMENWAREIQRHSDINTVKLHGKDIESDVNEWIQSGGAAVTTYESASKIVLPFGFSFAFLVADEAHYIKNPDAQRTKSLLKLKLYARQSLFMTGTPLENNVGEMRQLIKYLQPETDEKLDGMENIARAPEFRKAIAPVYIRRTREDVLQELPDLIENDEWCEPTLTDMRAYSQQVLSRNFMGMRQISWDNPDINDSSKAQHLIKICDEAALDGRKVIVFSFFRNTVDTVCRILGDRCVGQITGSIPSDERQKIIDNFSSAPDGSVLAAQIVAGGTGLNIQAASVVVLCEPQLKPSLENQAISRSYRMGQARSVIVYRLLCPDTVDEKLLDVLKRKQYLFDEFADKSESGAENLGVTRADYNRIIDDEIERIKLLNGIIYNMGEYSINIQ